MKTRKMFALLMAIALFLSGCSGLPSNPLKGNAVIDWVDFVKLGGHTYTRLWGGVVKTPSDVTGETVGEVQFKVADVVTNPEYRTKEGDAAFLAKGTKLYRVKGYESNQIIAAEDKNYMGGYRIYAEDGFAASVRRNYADISKDKVERIELYRDYTPKPFKTLAYSEQQQFLQLLNNGREMENYSPSNQNGDPVYYEMVFYTDEPLAYSFGLADDGANVYFPDRTTKLVDDEAAIRKLLQK